MREDVVESMKLGTYCDMEHYLGQGRSLMQQQTSDVVVEKASLSYSRRGLPLQDMRKTGQPIGLPHLVPYSEVRHKGKSDGVLGSKSSESSHQSGLVCKTCNDDELVKHMSNLPGFLQRVEKESSIQEKALNFGVLDWRQLEKWKYNERMPGKYPKKKSSLSSSSNSFSSTCGTPKLAPNLRNQRPSQAPNPSLLYSGKHPMTPGLRFSSPTRLPPTSRSSRLHSAQEKSTTNHQEEKNVGGITSKGKETCLQDLQIAQSCNIDGRQNRCRQKDFDEFHDRKYSRINMDDSKKKESNTSAMSEKDASQSDQLKDFTPSLPDKIHVSDPNCNMRLDDEQNFRTECCSREPQNIVLLRPKKTLPNRSCAENSQFTESRSSLDGQLADALANRLSNCFSPYSVEFDDIPHSCPLPSGPTDHTENGVADTNIPSEEKCSMAPRKQNMPPLSVEASDTNHMGRSEQPNGKGRTPSPTRRFSFNLGRMARSFSFKESSGIPEFSSEYVSVKSGPVKTTEVSPRIDNFQKDKGNTGDRGRSSPLRRLLDPLLKHKGSPTSEPTRRPPGSSSPMTVRTIGMKNLPQDRKPMLSTSQSLLQLSFKNGLPFFKLVVDNSSEMLAAVVKKLPISAKIDPCMIYTFYSVHEIKKKSMSWISQGSKSKSCSLGYNVVGQMKIWNSYHLKSKTADFSQCSVRECVLYGIDREQADKPTPAPKPHNKEIAAIVVKNSSKELCGELNEMNKLYQETAFPQYREANGNSNGMVVILPSGVHGTPTEGEPSSLISRWKSGGSCDCGGWDVGCKLRILSDSGKSCDLDHVNLFLQGGEQKNKPVFSLEPFSNGFYSIELDASVSLLEAFATCVACFTCRKFPEILDTENRSDADHFSEAVTDGGKMKTTATLQGEVPAKYVTCPPLSPAGRI